MPQHSFILPQKPGPLPLAEVQAFLEPFHAELVSAVDGVEHQGLRAGSQFYVKINQEIWFHIYVDPYDPEMFSYRADVEEILTDEVEQKYKKAGFEIVFEYRTRVASLHFELLFGLMALIAELCDGYALVTEFPGKDVVRSWEIREWIHQQTYHS
ncbi:hypothetical protein [Deinococcus roseus]|uniref:Uncharacterized protein n=1 Tax=Deinococcus roseus TaxID=392414 RepID=A0ABQ2CY81_9DEIO|nr:hypothetical protein [Deinococcus roseus]GGJ32221.1 hypothetical protein GCM10008938_18030 [Deinococcus roseus]